MHRSSVFSVTGLAALVGFALVFASSPHAFGVGSSDARVRRIQALARRVLREQPAAAPIELVDPVLRAYADQGQAPVPPKREAVTDEECRKKVDSLLRQGATEAFPLPNADDLEREAVAAFPLHQIGDNVSVLWKANPVRTVLVEGRYQGRRGDTVKIGAHSVPIDEIRPAPKDEDEKPNQSDEVELLKFQPEKTKQRREEYVQERRADVFRQREQWRKDNRARIERRVAELCVEANEQRGYLLFEDEWRTPAEVARIVLSRLRVEPPLPDSAPPSPKPVVLAFPLASGPFLPAPPATPPLALFPRDGEGLAVLLVGVGTPLPVRLPVDGPPPSLPKPVVLLLPLAPVPFAAPLSATPPLALLPDEKHQPVVLLAAIFPPVLSRPLVGTAATVAEPVHPPPTSTAAPELWPAVAVGAIGVLAVLAVLMWPPSRRRRYYPGKEPRTDGFDPAAAFADVPHVIAHFPARERALSVLTGGSYLKVSSNNTADMDCSLPIQYGFVPLEEGVLAFAAGPDLPYPVWRETRDLAERAKDGAVVSVVSPDPDIRLPDPANAGVTELGQFEGHGDDASCYWLFEAQSKRAARRFLAKVRIHSAGWHVVVQTPEGNWGRDRAGLYQE